MRTLVTGGLGFIGRHLVKRLLEESDRVIDVVDDMSNASPVLAATVVKHHRVNFIHRPVHEFHTDQYYQAIYHLASPVGPAGVLKYAGRMAQMIVSDAYKLAEMALRQDIPMLAISTSEVYGCDPNGRPQSEDLPKIVPSYTTVRLEYGVAKLLMEISLLNMHRARGLKICTIRPYNTVGPGQRGESGFVIPRFVEQALTGRPLTVFGDGEQKRTFTSVDDLVSGLLAVMEHRLYGQVFNVGNPDNIYSINEVADLVIQLTQSKSVVTHIDPKVIYGDLYEEAWNKIPDITKIVGATGWSPTERLPNIITRAVAAIR